MEKIARQAQATLKIPHISSNNPPSSKTPKIWSSLQIFYKTKVLTSFVSESKFFTEIAIVRQLHENPQL